MKSIILKSWTTIGLGLLLNSLLANTVKGETINSALTAKPLIPLLLTQVEGHDLYAGEGQIGCGLLVGHVVAKVGNIGFIVLPDGDLIHVDTNARSGDDVLLSVDDEDNYYYEGIAHAPWVTTLESDYGWRRLDYYCGNYVTLAERTAPLWAELESTSVGTAEIPPRATPPARTFTPEPQPEPVRGLW